MTGYKLPRTVESAVRRDLASMGDLLKGREALALMAVKLAKAIDGRGAEGPTTTAKLVQELRALMAVVMKRSDGDADDGPEPDQLPGPSMPAKVGDQTQP